MGSHLMCNVVYPPQPDASPQYFEPPHARSTSVGPANHALNVILGIVGQSNQGRARQTTGGGGVNGLVRFRTGVPHLQENAPR